MYICIEKGKKFKFAKSDASEAKIINAYLPTLWTEDLTFY